MNPYPPDTTPIPLTSDPVTPSRTPCWQTLSARDRPIPDDAWVCNVLNDPDVHARWQSFLDAPRFVISEDFAEWAVVVVSLQIEASGDDLLSLLFRMSSSHQTAAWSVCRKTRQIYRLPVLTLPTGSLFAHPNLPSHARSAAREHQLKPFATVGDWADEAARRVWERRLADRSHFELSSCSRPFYRAQESGEFASIRDGDRAWNATALLDGVVAIEARSSRERRQLWQRLHRRERQLARRAMKHISERLDSDVTQEARTVGLHDGLSAQRLNWLSQVPAGEQRTRRLQALVAAPLLLPMLLRSDTEFDTAAAESSTASMLDVAIEHGEPLFPLLAHLAGLTERTIRHLRTAMLREHHLTTAHELCSTPRKLALLSWLELIPVEQWPHTVRQWKLWVRVTVSLSRQARNVFHLLGDDPLPAAPTECHDTAAPAAVAHKTADALDFHVYAHHAAITHTFYRDLAARRWKLNLGDRHDFEWDREDGHTLDTVTFEMSDLLKSLRTGGQDDADGADAIDYDLPDSVCRELRSWSIAAWWTASDRWHQFLVDAGALQTVRVSRYSNDGEVLQWRPLLEQAERPTSTAAEVKMEEAGPATATPNRMSSSPPLESIDPEFRQIEFLSNSQTLLEEGAAMSHCVSARVDDCLTGRTHIGSVTDQRGGRCSTLAIRLDYVAGQWCPVLTEHRTLRNRRPDEASVIAVEQLMVTLAQPELQARFQHIEAARVERETTLRARLPDRRNRAASLHRAALQAALPEHLFLQMDLDDR